MSKIIPFEALIPRKDLADRVVCPPYDVIDSDEARKLAKGNPYSMLHVTKPEIDLPDETMEDDDRIYAKGIENLQRFVEDGTLIRDRASIYVYRLAMGEIVQTGVVCGVSADEYERGLIKKHEKTREPKVVDRTRLACALHTHAEPVILVHRADEGIRALLAKEAGDEPLFDVKYQGVRHTLWRANDPQGIVAAFSRLPALYIADGHHRSETGCRTMQWMRRDNPGHTGGEAYNFFPAAVFPDDEVRVFRYEWDGPADKRPLADVTMADIMKLSDQNGIMPPKSTWFAPKLISGLFLYTF
ncbi:MAG: DUF1015 domain-containing protein [Proteobacteria bacterium]|nr:DUF1015 domain-containing protein [Pseudomonadota bacterium]